MLICANHSNAIRWQEGERLDHLFEKACDDARRTGGGADAAVILDDRIVTYTELDEQANRTARYLRKLGIGPGQRVGLLVNKSLHTYIAMLAVLKLNAAYVPLDAGFPRDRISYIAGDAEVGTVITLSDHADHLQGLGLSLVLLDEAAGDISAEAGHRLSVEERGNSDDQLCYIIYTSGSTGNPKGVAIEHPSICNFVAVAAEVYGMKPDDRVYQGMTIAFDFSVEELWVPLIVGAALVPGRPDTNLLGADLAGYLIERNVTALCCVPTLLATIEQDLPQLRFLLVSGEACPRDLVKRWHRDGRVFLNAYGPTEASVTATITEVHPDKSVTIGGPLPTYTIVILEEDEDKLVEDGGMGEICIAGIALAKGYVNRDDLTTKAFIPDFLDIENNPAKRIYRTGDLGRIDENGEIEFHGRIDTQVKVRGYRIELTEIESVFMEVPEVALCVVDTYETAPGVRDLVAYYTLKEGFRELPCDRLSELLRARLPAYMIPTYVEELADIPMLPSQKADRKKLPAPAGPRFVAASKDVVAPRTETEQLIAEALARVLGIEAVSVDDNFFDDLGAHSLLMAQLSAALRDSLPHVALSMREIYLNPTVAGLAAFADAQEPAESVRSETQDVHIASTFDYVLCGALQFAHYAVFGTLALGTLLFGLLWVLSADQIVDTYLRASFFAAGAFGFFSALPVAVKWLVIGRWKEQAIPVWSLEYFRFWAVRQLIQVSPVNLFRGTPIINVYLRLLGARIGRGALIQSKILPVCTDLVEIGEGAVVRKDSVALGYKAVAGRIHTGPVRVGRNACVGEAALLDIHTSMGDDAQLGHASSLHQGQAVPAGKRYHGSPAQETETDFNRVAPASVGTARRVLYSVFRLVTTLLVAAPLPFILLFALTELSFGSRIGGAADVISHLPPGIGTIAIFSLASLVLIAGAIAVSLLSVVALPRLLNMLMEEGRTYPLFGVHHVVNGLVSVTSNVRYFNILFGDSSFIMHYLLALGYKVDLSGQTGSNFGNDQRHDNPLLCRIGKGTMISDGLTMSNAEYSASSFRLSRVQIGENSFFGNNVHYPAGARTGRNCLLATKVMVPVDGPVRENVGLLGSPCFEIPRSVERDTNVGAALDETSRREGLRAKNRHNLFTIASTLFYHWSYLFLSMLLGYGFVWLNTLIGLWALPAALLAFTVFSIGFFALIGRWSLGREKLEARTCSIYEKHYWKVEHYWKRNETPLMTWFRGTPFKNIMSRLSGIRVGARVFDDGFFASEKSMVEIGDFSTLNVGAVIQCHSLEDGVFKSDFVKIGHGCTIGGSSYLQYGITMGDRSVLAPDSFLMKGEVVGAGTTWQGNPARQV